MCRVNLRKLLCAVVLGGAIAGSGCADTVMEDRSIEWSGEGRTAAFQHGRDGVFISDDDGGGARRIFMPDADVLATSTPLWSPDGRRVLFTTARAEDAGSSSEKVETPLILPEWDEQPDGRLFFPQAVNYTCWLGEKPDADRPAESVQLFTAKCDHVGYVAANLAVRWHPDGKRVLFVDRLGEGGHGVFEYELNGGRIRQALPQAADRILFDWSPDGSRLACVVSDGSRQTKQSGIWIGNADYDDWWQVNESAPFIELRGTESPAFPEPADAPDSSDPRPVASIETLRSLRPVWQRASRYFAFAGAAPGSSGGDASEYVVMRGDAETRQVERWHAEPAPIGDIEWSPDGRLLGFVRQGEQPSLFLLHEDSHRTGPVNHLPVRRFAGWDSTGGRIAYTAVDAVDEPRGSRWALLLSAVPEARDRLIIADGTGEDNGRVLFANMRITFARWSPKQQKISLWATFAPRYESWWSRWFRWGLRPGDPAAIVDVETGEVQWMPVSPREKIQVGHYYLLHNDYERAVQWYETAEREFPGSDASGRLDFLFSSTSDSGFELMHGICLSKLGRQQAAKEKFAQFRALWKVQPLEEGNDAPESQRRVPDPATLRDGGLLLRLLEESYVAEVFLSLNQEQEGLQFMLRELESADDGPTRLSRAVLLTQFLLRQERLTEYCRIAIDEVLPLLIDSLSDENSDGEHTARRVLEELPAMYVGAALLPLYTEEFLAGLEEDALIEIAERLETMQRATNRESGCVTIDRLLVMLYQRIDQPQKLQTVRARLDANGALKPLIPLDELMRQR